MKNTLFILMFIPCVALAQFDSTASYFTNAGISFPSSPDNFHNNWNPGFNLGIGLNTIITGQFWLQGDLSYHHFGFNKDNYLRNNGVYGYDIQVDGGSAWALNFSINGRILLNSNPKEISPYLIAGVGFAKISEADIVATYRDISGRAAGISETDLSAGEGGGLVVPYGERNNFFIDLRYMTVFANSDNISSIVLRFGISMPIIKSD